MRSHRLPCLALATLLLGALALPCLPAADEPAAAPLPGLIATLKGHTEAVYAVAFSPDGKQVVTGSFDKTLRVWDAATGKSLKTFGGPTGHQNLVLSIAVSPDGTLIASGGSDNTARIWDFPTSKHIQEFAQGDAANAVAVSADGKLVAGGGKDGVVKIWDAADGKERFTLTGHTGPVTGLSFSPNGQFLVSSGEDRTLRFWSPTTGKLTAVVGAHGATVTGVAFNNSSNIIYSTGADGTLKFWALPVAARSLPPFGGAVTALYLSADGNQLVAGGADKSVRLATVNNGQTVRTFTGPQETVASTALAPNNALIAAGTSGGRLFVWQAKDAKVVAETTAHAGGVNAVAFNSGSTELLTGGADGQLRFWSMPPVAPRGVTTPEAVQAAAATADGKRLFTGGADKVLRAWDLANPKAPTRQFSGHRGAIHAVAVSADGKVLVSAGAGGTLRFWNQSNGQQTSSIGAHAGAVNGLALTPSGQVLSCSADGSLKLWQPPAAAPKLYAHPDQVTAAALSADGTYLLTGCSDKQVRLWDLAKGNAYRTFSGHTLAVQSVALGGTRAAAGGADKTLLVWDIPSNKQVQKFAGLPAAAPSVALSPDGKFVAGGLADSTIHVFDLTTGKEVKKLDGHTGPVTALTYTAKGDQLLSGSEDKTVRVWDVATGTAKATLEHGAAVRALALSKDGTRVASGGADKAVKVWTLADGKAVATVTTPAAVHGVGFGPGGKRLVVAGADNLARVYGTDGKLMEFFAHDGPVQAAAIHSDGKRVFTASADKTARGWTLALVWQAHHDGPVRQALVSARGDRIVSAGDDKSVRIWNAADGKPVQTLAAHDGPVTGVGLSADGTRLASSGADKTVKVWNLAAKPGAKEEPKPLVVKLPAEATGVALSANGQRLAVALGGEERAGEVRVLDAATGKDLLTAGSHAGGVRALAFLADNRTLLSAGADKMVRLLDVNVARVLDAHAGGVTGAVYHPNGTQVLSGGADKTVKLWEAATGKLLRTFGPLPEGVRAVALSRDGVQVTAAAGKVVKVWTTADGKEVTTLNHPAEVHSVAISPDRTRLATAAGDNWARVWEVATGRELQSFPHAGPARAVAFSSNTVVVSAGDDKAVTIGTLTVNKALAAGTPLRGLALTPSNTHVLTAGDDGKVKVWNANSGVVERALDAGDKPLQAVAVAKNGQAVAAGGADAGVRLFNFADGKLLGTFKASGAVRGLAFGPKSDVLAAACADNTLKLWNILYTVGQPPPAEFGRLVQDHAHAGPVADVVFTPAGTTFYSASADKTVRAWKFASEGSTRTLTHPNLVDAVAFNPAGTLLATGCHDGRVRIFDVAKGSQVRSIDAHILPAPGQPIYSVAWSLDGKQVVSGSYDHSLKVWDATTGKLVIELKAYKEKAFEKGHRDGVFCVAFSPDGKSLASGGQDHAIKIWKLADGSVTRELANPALKVAAGGPPQAHPGWVYGVRWTPDGKKLVSAGGAPRGSGSLAVWDAATGKMLFSQEAPLGTFYGLAVSPDGKRLALGTGGRSRATGEDLNAGYILALPEPMK